MVFSPISAKSRFTRLKRLQDRVLEAPGHIAKEWLEAKRFVAIPVEGGMHFTENDLSNILAASQVVSEQVALAIAAEELLDFPAYWTVSLDQEGLSSFSFKCASLNFLLIPEGETFAILCTIDDYFIVSGPLGFVERAIGSTLDNGHERFRQYAEEAWEGMDQERLLAVLSYYSENRAKTKESVRLGPSPPLNSPLRTHPLSANIRFRSRGA